MSRGARAAATVLGAAGAAVALLSPWLAPALTPAVERYFSPDHHLTARGVRFLTLSLAGLGAAAVALGLLGRRLAGESAADVVRHFADLRDGRTTYWGLAGALAAIVLGLGGFALWRRESWYYGEDRALESAQVLALAAAACLFALAARQVRAQRHLRMLQLVQAAGAAAWALEELSWGQRLFGWTTPRSWAQVNAQGETNLHNLVTHHARLVYGLAVAALLALALAGFVLRLRRRGAGLSTWLLPQPCHFPIPAAMALLHWRTLVTGNTDWNEAQEFLAAALFLLLAAGNRARAAYAGAGAARRATAASTSSMT